MARQRVKFQRAVRLMTVEEDGDACDGDMGKAKDNEYVAPPG
jgi:hypothetical protein